MNKLSFTQHLAHPELLESRTINELQEIVNEYPFFQTARLLLLKNLNNQGDIRYERELKKTALWTTDRKKLFYLLDSRVLLSITEDIIPTQKDTSTSTSVQPQSSKTISTKTIKLSNVTKFKTIPKKKPIKPKRDELEELILSGSAGTGTFFNVDDKVDLDDFKNTFSKSKPKDPTENKVEETKESRRNLLIDNFIEKQPKIAKLSEKDETQITSAPKMEAPESEMITDTLAKIYIKQGFYEKAIHSYEKLSLKYPEKNIYFADQIKKIKELFNNQ